MRELTKSMFSYTWAMSLFGVQQMLNMLTFAQGDRDGKATEAFEDITDATCETFDGSLKSAFRAGDDLQRGMVDLMFGGFMGWGGCNMGWRRQGGDWRSGSDRGAGRRSDSDMGCGRRGDRRCWDGTRGMADAGGRTAQRGAEAARDMADAGARTAQRTADAMRDMTDTATYGTQRAATDADVRGAASGQYAGRSTGQSRSGAEGWGPMPRQR